ncbi:hypothetical protein B0H19DRAFT_1239649 [Mycena capillaripes]|nr:hypothetical protein B0H19DRAFT_1239649 [Mycena capillaripes]
MCASEGRRGHSADRHCLSVRLFAAASMAAVETEPGCRREEGRGGGGNTKSRAGVRLHGGCIVDVKRRPRRCKASTGKVDRPVSYYQVYAGKLFARHVVLAETTGCSSRTPPSARVNASRLRTLSFTHPPLGWCLLRSFGFGGNGGRVKPVERANSIVRVPALAAGVTDPNVFSRPPRLAASLLRSTACGPMSAQRVYVGLDAVGRAGSVGGMQCVSHNTSKSHSTSGEGYSVHPRRSPSHPGNAESASRERAVSIWKSLAARRRRWSSSVVGWRERLRTSEIATRTGQQACFKGSRIWKELHKKKHKRTFPCGLNPAPSILYSHLIPSERDCHTPDPSRVWRLLIPSSLVHSLPADTNNPPQNQHVKAAATKPKMKTGTYRAGPAAIQEASTAVRNPNGSEPCGQRDFAANAAMAAVGGSLAAIWRQ